MFSGITETLGRIQQLDDRDDCRHFTITHHGVFDDIHLGDSIAVNGVCLTVTAFDASLFKASAVPETLRLTNLGYLKPGSDVNLERSIRANQRIGGHFVQGHVDTTACITDIQDDGKGAILVTFKLNPTYLRYIIQKGYIAIDGMSITVINTTNDSFTVTFIPHTKANTVVKHYQINHLVNIEVDMLGKYLEKLSRGDTHAANSSSD
ncbi:MAG TPA: riboflavin synthase [Gammaproteobacteria bacterium]|nr:riboflavin synthase [Gammaproteobacteria bacterium]